jgi:16S rRNA (cytidine1402-2'-O)-methyltransferase
MLLLLPNLLDEELNHHLFLPASVDAAVASLDGLIAESEKSARRYLKRFTFPSPKTFRDIPIHLLNEHTPEQELGALLEPLKRGKRWGVVSDCGLPCLADPGARLIARAHILGIPMEALVGPSSITLALMLSGFSAQAFAFHGYLERDAALLQKQLRMLEERSKKEKSTQLFIEAPYRNDKMLEQLTKTLGDATMLCTASNLTSPNQQVICKSIKDWKSKPLPPLNDHPTVFLFSS